MKLSRQSVNRFLVNAFVAICVIFPGDVYCLKKVLFLAICIFNLRLMFNSLFSRKNSLIAFFGLVFPTCLLLYSAILTGDLSKAFSRSFSAYMLVIIFVVKYHRIDFEKILIRSTNIITLTTLSLAVLDLLNIIDVNTGFFRNEIVYKYGLGVMGKSLSYPFYYKIFFKTSPLMVISLFRSLDASRYLTAALSVAALVLSGTRANVAFPILLSVTYYVLHSRQSKLIKNVIVFSAIVFSMLFSSSVLAVFNQIFIVKGEISDIVRQGHMQGIVELVQDDPWIIIRGSGMGSSFYSYGTNSLVSNIEWSFIDLWRQMGFGLFFLFVFFITSPFLYQNIMGEYKKYAYVSYLLIASTNPLLFSSTSYLFYIYMYYDLKPPSCFRQRRGET